MSLPRSSQRMVLIARVVLIALGAMILVIAVVATGAAAIAIFRALRPIPHHTAAPSLSRGAFDERLTECGAMATRRQDRPAGYQVAAPPVEVTGGTINSNGARATISTASPPGWYCGSQVIHRRQNG
jgi:hypothetical protein